MRNTKHDINNRRVNWLKLKWIRVTKADTDTVYFNYRMKDQFSQIKIKGTSRRGRPQIWPARLMTQHVRANHDRSWGFRVFFSFHNMSALPQQLPGGMWNCSVPHWADFQQHFLCTLEPECIGGEDKLICPWKDTCALFMTTKWCVT
nr:hypothetical protein BaRGS_027627 [Batillaria attramentaria]